MVDSWYYYQWRSSDWVFYFNIWFASANIRPNPYLAKLMIFTDLTNIVVDNGAHYHCILIAIIKSLIVNSISSSNIHNHMNSRYGIKNMLILIQSKNHLTKLIGINYSKTENKLTILTSILHLSTHPLIMTALCQVPLSFTLNLGFLPWILLKIVTALNINKAHGHEISIRNIKICDEALVKPCL